MATIINLNNTTPAAPTSGQNVLWQSNNSSSPQEVSAYLALGSTNTQVLFNSSDAVTGNANLTFDATTGLSTKKPITIAGATSGSSALGVAAVAGTPNQINLPTATGAANAVLITNGSNPQQTSWDSTVTRTIASGTQALATSSIASGAAATTISVSATGVLSTDNVLADFNSDPTRVTGYAPSTSGMLTIIKYCSTDHVNFIVVNNTGSSITPGAITLNYRVVR